MADPMKVVTIATKATLMREPGLPVNSTMGAIEEVYHDLEADLSLAEFETAVADKIEAMGGLADEETAAMLVAHELGEHRILEIGDVHPDLHEARFLAKVRQVGELRTFERDGEEDDGCVINVEAVDETGAVRLAFWDDHARAIDEDGLEPGTVLRVKGRPKDGFAGLEVSVHHVEEDPDAEIDVDLSRGDRIADLAPGQSGVNLRGRLLAVESIRTFERDDGSEGKVSNLVLGDDSGRIRVALWDERATVVDSLSPDDCVEIRDGAVRERDGRLECHLGDRGAIEQIEEVITFVPEKTPIEALEEGDVVDLAGVIRSIDEKRTFERDDGSSGQVRNVRLQDETGDIRVAMWGEDADRDLAPGDTVWIGDVEIREGWQDDLEASVGWQSTVAAVELSAVRETHSAHSTESANGETDLGDFAEDTGTDSPAESTTFTGTVVQTGSPVIVDDGEEAMRVETDRTVTLGEEVTVRGVRRGDRIDADELVPADGKR